MESTAQTAPGQSFSWESLVPLLVHPAKVAIIEAMAYIELPLSATDLDRLLQGEASVSLLSYHLRKLAEIGAIERVRQDTVRGAVQTFYGLPGSRPLAARVQTFKIT
jgi:DNA-binding transcriptional ArsR family regulator